MRARRDSIPGSERARMSALVGRTLRKLDLYKKARTVMFYASFGSEVATAKMVKTALSDGKRIVFPYLGKIGSPIRAAAVKCTGKDLKKGLYGIKEPVPGACVFIAPEKIDMVLVPAVAYDEKCARIGYGKGYYDRWLSKIPLKSRVGIAFDSQIAGKIPQCRGDVPVGTVVTDKRVIYR